MNRTIPYNNAGHDGGQFRPLSLRVEAKGDTARIEISGEIARYSNASSREFKRQLVEAKNKGCTKAHLVINSPGGEVFEANQMVIDMQSHFKNITGEGHALVASAASYIAVKCDKFELAENGTLMLHRVTGGQYGNADQMRSVAEALEMLEKNYVKAYAQKSGKSEADIQARINKGDWWMNAKQAKDAGFVDSIIDRVEITSEDVSEIRACAGSNQEVVVPEVAAPANNQDSTITNKAMTKEQLMQAAIVLGLAATATAEDVLGKVQALQAENTRLKGVESELTNLKNQSAQDKKTAQETEAKTIIAQAVKDKKILASEEDFYNGLFAKDFDGTKALLASKPVAKLPIAPQEPAAEGETEEDKVMGAFKGKGYKEIKAADGGLEFLRKLKAEHPAIFEKLHNAAYAGE